MAPTVAVKDLAQYFPAPNGTPAQAEGHRSSLAVDDRPAPPSSGFPTDFTPGIPLPCMELCGVVHSYARHKYDNEPVMVPRAMSRVNFWGGIGQYPGLLFYINISFL
jgi:hypothetical protein